MSYSATATESMASPCSKPGPLVRAVSGASCDSHRSELSMRVGSTESAVSARSRRPGALRARRRERAVASAREQVTHEGDCLVPLVWVNLGVPGDDRHEEVLAFKTPGGR